MSNEELAVLIQNGDREREIELWEQVRRFAMKLANKWLAAFRSRSDVEFDDLMSVAYIAMCEAVATYKPDSGSFIGWYSFYLKDGYTTLYGLRTRRTANDPLNNAISLSTPLDDNGEITLGDAVADPNSTERFERVEDALYRQELHNALCEALKIIPAEYLSVIERRYFNGQTIKSIAADLLTTVNEVKRCESGGLWAIRRSPAINTLRSFSDFDFYKGTGLSSFKRTGTSIQENYLLYEENAEMCDQKKDEFFGQYHLKEKSARFTGRTMLCGYFGMLILSALKTP